MRFEAFKVNQWVFYPAVTLIGLFALAGVVASGPMDQLFGWLQNAIVDGFGWFYILSVALFLIFVIWLPLSRFAHVRLGKDNDRPEFNYLTWVAMLFSAGMGIGLVFYGVAEPILHFGNPPFAEGRSVAAANEAMNLTFFHWGLHAWAIYIVIGLSLAYFAYRHDLPLTVRSTLYPLLGERIHGPIGNLIDVVAVFGTLFGLATSLGLGVMQINAGLDYLGLLSLSTFNQILLILVITVAATLSVLSGLGNGIRRLSELNMGIGGALLLFVLLVGPTTFLLSTFVQSTGQYVSGLLHMTFRTDAFLGLDWQKSWTMFYWGWWISWSPFVGMFIARISRGRTIREFVVGVLLVPTLFMFFWMTVFGGTAIHLDQLADGKIVQSVNDSVSTAIFVMLNELPWAAVTATLTVIVVAIFFVTSADSGSMVIDILSSGGRTDTPLMQKTFWTGLVGMIAAVLLFVGGLSALQTAAITTALPFAVVMLFICWGLYRALSAEQTTHDPVQEIWGGLQRLPTSAARTIRAVPAAASTLADAFGSGRPQALKMADHDSTDQGDWRERLRRITAEPEPSYQQKVSDLSEAEASLRTFFDETVVPAFETLKAELETQGRTATITREGYTAQLSVFVGDTEEFRYGIEGHAREDVAFAFPKFYAERRPARATAEVVLRSGREVEKDVTRFDQERIIEDFLRAYAKWMGW